MEFTPVELPYGKKTRKIWMSINVLPLQDATWLIASYPCRRNPVNIEVQRWIDRMLSTVYSKRRCEDMRMMCSSTNLYASPEEYRSMQVKDKAKISSSWRQRFLVKYCRKVWKCCVPPRLGAM